MSQSVKEGFELNRFVYLLHVFFVVNVFRLNTVTQRGSFASHTDFVFLHRPP